MVVLLQVLLIPLILVLVATIKLHAYNKTIWGAGPQAPYAPDLLNTQVAIDVRGKKEEVIDYR